MGLLSKIFGKKEEKPIVQSRKNHPDVYFIKDDSDRMNWYMEKANLTLHYFIECLNNPKKDQQYFSVKGRFEDKGMVEHIWLSEPSVDAEGNLFGTVGNEPTNVTTVKLGQKIGITASEVSDWMIIERGRLIGGYTIRAIREGMNPDQQIDFDKTLGGMHVDEGEDHFLPNFETPEGAIIALENAYDSDNLDAAVACKNFQKEAEFMLQKTMGNVLDPDAELVNSTAEVLKLSFIKGTQEDGMPKFKNVKRAFKREQLSDDHFVITEICYYPDGNSSWQKLNTYRANGEWKVMNPID
jgi:uncharacterized protein YegJ (DUF2314 family)